MAVAGSVNQMSAAVYRALFVDLDEGNVALPSVQSTIWRAIDYLHKTHEDGVQIIILEAISVELHALCSAPVTAVEKLAALSQTWLSHGRLLQ